LRTRNITFADIDPFTFGVTTVVQSCITFFNIIGFTINNTISAFARSGISLNLSNWKFWGWKSLRSWGRLSW
jgi:hypothetical protein